IGTRIVVSSPPRPYMSLPIPFWPRCALNWRWWRKSISVFRPSSATSHTLPPSPPSPPLGPPNGMNFSRRKLAQPSPPLPACTLMMASSTNFMVTHGDETRASVTSCRHPGASRGPCRSELSMSLGYSRHPWRSPFGPPQPAPDLIRGRSRLQFPDQVGDRLCKRAPDRLRRVRNDAGL